MSTRAIAALNISMKPMKLHTIYARLQKPGITRGNARQLKLHVYGLVGGVLADARMACAAMNFATHD
jgi:hypothetical protein